MAHVMTMPEVLAGADEATVADWSVTEGDTVAAGDTIAEIETEKALVDLPAQVGGTVGRLLVQRGQTVAVGTPLVVLLAAGESIDSVDIDSTIGAAAPATIASPDGAPAPATQPQPAVAQVVTAGATSARPTPEAAGARADVPAVPPSEARHFASPLARRIARERGVDVTAVAGSGPDGRVTRRDVERHMASRAPVQGRSAPPAAASPEAVVPHSRMRRTIARRLTEAKASVPHFYLRADCRVDALLELRSRINEVSDERVSVNDLVVKAVAQAFGRVPEANVRWSEEGTVHLTGVDVSVAVSVADGLLTPVVRGVDSRPVAAVSADIKDLAERARSSSLRQHELEGGTMTVSNLGMYGVREFGAIINPPQCGILAVGAAEQRALVVGGAVTVATVMTVTLSADHRVLDGELAARWLSAFVEVIESPIALLV